jgi:hypothetical protein
MLGRLFTRGKNGKISVSFLGWLILAVLTLVVMVFIYQRITGNTIAGLNFAKNLFKWG